MVRGRRFGGRVELGHWCRVTREIRPDFGGPVVESDLETPMKGTRALAHGYKLLDYKDLFGGEGGIRTQQEPLDYVSYRF